MYNIASKKCFAFFLGFSCGFIASVLQDKSLSSHKFFKNTVKLSKGLISYENWSAKQNIKLLDLNLDAFFYNLESENVQLLLEASWLTEKVPLTCLVFSENFKLLEAIYKTWGKHCNKLLFFSQKIASMESLNIINLNTNYTSSWHFLCEAINHLWKNYNNSLKWVIFVKDDVFVIPENLRYFLAPLNCYNSYYLGHAITLWGQAYNVAQAGFVLSYAALRSLSQKFNSSEKCISGGKYWKKEDYYLGKHLQSLGIHPSDTRDRESLETFNAYSLNALFWGVARAGNYFTRALYPSASTCCSRRIITFAVEEPSKVHTINYLLYNLHIFRKGTFGNKPASTLNSESEAWATFIREEFNVTNLISMSNENYYNLWRSRYSEPGKLIAKIKNYN